MSFLPTLLSAIERVADATSSEDLVPRCREAVTRLTGTDPAVAIWRDGEQVHKDVPEPLAVMSLSHLVPMEPGGPGAGVRSVIHEIFSDGDESALIQFEWDPLALSLLVPGMPSWEEEKRLAMSVLCKVIGEAVARVALVEIGFSLAAQVARLESIAGAAIEITSLIDGEGTFSFASASIARILGYEGEDLIDTSCIDLTHPDERPMLQAMLAKAHELEEGIDFECRFLHRDGHWIQSYAQLRNRLEDPILGSLVLTIRDVSDRKALEEELAHAALHDSLTNLPNRSLFRDRVGHALARAERHDKPVGVLLIDLDNFKRVNDSEGHAIGDGLLKAVAERIQENLRGPDTAARLGSDEFALLLEDIRHKEDGTLVAERISSSMSEPFEIAGHELRVAVSIGVAVATPKEQKADDLIRDADVAMHTAKSRGKGQIAIFESSMHESLLERIGLESDLRRAIKDEEFLIYYQPTVNLQTGKIAGMEALVRWMHPRRGLVPPLSFIPLAEETGLIVEIGRIVLEVACKQAREWQLKYPDNPMTISVNLSARQLQSEDLIAEVRGVLEDSGLAPKSLVLEITESVLMEDTLHVETTLQALKDLGVRLAIDDFGTGYSSLSYLQKLPVDILKIDRSFVSGLHTGSQELAVTKAIVELGQTLELQTVAEGIELAEQLMHLKAMHCDLCQGYYFARPLEPTDMDLLLERAASGAPWAEGHKAAAAN